MHWFDHILFLFIVPSVAVNTQVTCVFTCAKTRGLGAGFFKFSIAENPAAVLSLIKTFLVKSYDMKIEKDCV